MQKIKSLFETRKKAIITSVCLVAILAIIGAGTASAATTIGAKRARNIALKHASLTAEEITFLHTELDYEDGIPVYEIEFSKGNTEYDYEISATTGKILRFEQDTVKDTPKSDQTQKASEAAAHIGVDSAKQIAVSHAGLAYDSVLFQEAKLEEEDGKTVYEIEFYKNGSEYEYTIDAISGTVLEYGIERDTGK